MTFIANCRCTGIGSLPHVDADSGMELIMNRLNDIPFWPQLPKLGFFENMYAQYSEGLPGVVIENNKMYIDTVGDHMEDMERFFEGVLAEDLATFEITRERAAGLWALLDMGPDAFTKAVAIKGQITGPISFGLQVTDQDRKPILYNDMYRDLVRKLLSMKARWQVEKLRHLKTDTILFVDEPYLSAVGSGFINLKREDVVEDLAEVVHSVDSMVATHCCANTDWSILIDAGVNIISFDAYSYSKPFLLYADKLIEFMRKGGILAWGMVPAEPDKLKGRTVDELKGRLLELMGTLEAKGADMDMLLSNALLTPSCGLGTGEVEDAALAFGLLSNLSETMRSEFSLP